MCGIFGIISQKRVIKQQLVKVSKTISHRGPDDEGYLLFNNNTNEYQCALGNDSIKELRLPKIEFISKEFNSVFLHRRLSIIDLSPSGHQPMSYSNERFWITLNGEIYNYIELKEDLLKKGYEFKSTSDTEVVLAAYQEWGEDCIKRFNGMWAFAIWDRHNNLFFLSRDRVGIKPFYYYYKDGDFIFCSEIKGILAYLDTKAKFNQNKIREYLVKGQVIVGESEETIFEGIKQLLPGHNIILKNQKIKVSKYWEININISEAKRKDHLSGFLKLFHDSIKLRMRSDVEVGSCLSGGIDSSSIVSYASKKFNVKFNTFSAIWPNSRHDEFKYMKLVNEMYNAHTNYIETDLSDIIGLIDKITWHQEIPIAGSSLVAQWNVMKKAREQDVPVLLDGQGADEILSGYPFYLIPYINELISKRKIKELIKFINNSRHHGFSFKKIIKRQIKQHLLNKPLKERLPISDLEISKYNNSLKYNQPQDSSFLPDFLKEQIKKSNLPSLLHFEDRNSMAHSIEARVPFLDFRLLEYSLNIPSEQKIGNGFTKTILRDTMKDYVPSEVFMRRDKIGFSTPIEEQLNDEKSDLFAYMDNYLKSSDLWNSNIIDKKKYQSKHLFTLYSLQRFFEIYSAWA